MDTHQRTLAWVFLVLCGVFEVVWAYTMKLSHGFTDPFYTVVTIVFLAINLFLLEKPVSILGIGVSYGVFTGLGIVGTTIAGIIGLGESIDPIKIASIVILMTGVIGLKYCDAREAAQKASQALNQYRKTLAPETPESPQGDAIRKGDDAR